MGSYLTFQGNQTKADDRHRLIWYSATCGYWTDDWEKLASNKTDRGHGIPCCPTCRMVGMQVEAGNWFDGAAMYDREQPGYLEFLNSQKETCHGRVGLMAAWDKHRATLPKKEPGA
jgi:hypothetical protein